MFFVVKLLLLSTVFIVATTIGYLLANQYSKRVAELEDFICALGLFETKITYTYDDLIDTFMFISDNLKTRMYRIFFITAEQLRENNAESAGDLFRMVVEEEKIFLALKPKDIEIVKGLAVSLGQMDLESQIKNIHLVESLVQKELQEAYEEKQKNFKLYRNMGVTGGLVLIILLI